MREVYRYSLALSSDATKNIVIHKLSTFNGQLSWPLAAMIVNE